MASRCIDLHTHSTASDGTDRPSLVIAEASKAGLSAIALTDHDTVDGLEEAAEESAKAGIDLIPGIEIAVRPEGSTDELHIVGLWIDRHSASVHAYLADLRAKREKRNEAMLQRLEQLALPVSNEDVQAESEGRAIGRPHIARAMCTKGYVESVKEAFERYLGHGAAAFVPRELDDPEQGIGFLHRAGATPILAHPCLTHDMTRARLSGILKTFSSFGLAGVEAYHSAHTPEQVRMCVELAEEFGLFLSGGSDYHGGNKPGIQIGIGKGNLRIPWTLLEKMKEARRAKGLWV